MLKIIYTLFLGLILAVFVGIGVSVFYNAPSAPAVPEPVRLSGGEPSAETEQAQLQYEVELEEYHNRDRTYNRNVSIVLTIAAVAMLIVGVGLSHKLDVLSDGILLGGVFTLIYAIGRGLASDDEVFRFVVVSIGLAIALGLGWWKFVRPAAGKAGSA
jgi:hypothetical protein